MSVSSTAAESAYEQLCREAHIWRERVGRDNATAADRAALREWLAQDVRHEEAYDSAITYAAAFDQLRPKDIDPAYLNPSIAERLTATMDAIFRSAALPSLRIAAGLCVASLIGLAWMIMAPAQNSGPSHALLATFKTATGQRSTFTLSDGSTVTLDAQSQLTFEVTQRRRRAILKTGAAYFDVEPDRAKPFSVEASDLTATAVGTAFDVKAANGVYRVAVAEGKVAVTYPLMVDEQKSGTNVRRLLKAGEQVAALENSGIQKVQAIAIENVGAWRADRLVYDGATLAEIIADVNRYSAQRVVFGQSAVQVSEKTLSGVFQTKDQQGLLSLLELSFPISIAENQDGVIEIQAKKAP